jgi:eukaryotic-like serine/threonine-protein kinase
MYNFDLPQMPLISGSRVGPYEVVDLLGAGGMGEVYRARDTRLERTVALKVLPDALAADGASRARFEREARAISALNHPHICALHDVGRHENADYLVLELLEGETLAARLERGALPLNQVLKIGAEIADALGAAHRQGIVHRDLKPANMMLTPLGVKLLDFGLAKPSPLQFPTAVTIAQTTDLTARGTIVGTVQYMSPEQLQGLDADARTDIFGLGAILYEMCTGRRAFEGQGQASLIAKILETDPAPVSTLVPLVPPAFDQLVQRCLAKDPADRWQSAHDLALQLRGMRAQLSSTERGMPAVPRSPRVTTWLTWAAAPVAVALALAGWMRPGVPLPAEATPLRFDIELPAHIRLGNLDGPVISPDGRSVAYTAEVDGVRQLFRTDLSTQHAIALPDTQGASLPFWSPDSRDLGFFAGGMLRRVPASGGPVRVLAPSPESGGGTWGDGFILFVPGVTASVHRVPDAGGRAEPLEMPGLYGYVFPHLLPDGRAFLIVERGSSTLYAVPLEAPDRLEPIASPVVPGARYAAGHLVYRQGPTLLGASLGVRRFDPARREVTGAFQQIAENARWFSLSQSGTIAFRSDPPRPRQLTWFTRAGARAGTVGKPGHAIGLSLAPQGRRAAVWQDTGGNVDIWSIELSSGIFSRMTSDPGIDADPAWSPDGRTIAFTSNRSGRPAVYLKHLGDGREELLAELGVSFAVDAWTPDGTAVVARTYGRAVYLVPVEGDRTPQLLVDTPYTEDELRISPDGRWVVFNSDESGRWEIYVARFPDFTAKRQLSAAGGVQPQWRADGKEVFFLSLDSVMTSVSITLGDELVTDAVITPLFATNIAASASVSQYAVTSDGQRFLALDQGEEERHAFTYLLNFVPASAQPSH